jgi:hypothetical protein
MKGPILLRPIQVDMSVPSRVGGVYCLGRSAKSVAVVGRVERDLRDKIKSHWPEYQMFWYEPALGPRECYVHHCYAYHRHSDNGLESKEHPVPPGNVDVKCPICGQ